MSEERVSYGLVFEDGAALAEAYEIFSSMLAEEMPNAVNAGKVVNVLFSIIVLGILDKEAALDVLGCPPSVLDSYLREVLNTGFVEQVERVLTHRASGGSMEGARSHVEDMIGVAAVE